MLPPFEVVQRIRPVDLVSPGRSRISGDAGGVHDLPSVAPYVAATCHLPGPASLAFLLAGRRLEATWDGTNVALRVDEADHRSRRFGRADAPARLGLTLTGPHLTAWVLESEEWVARARRDLREELDVHDEAALGALRVETSGTQWEAGGFGQLGLRDLRLVSHADGTPWQQDGAFWLSATSAGPGFFDSGHTSVWRLDPDELTMEHHADLYFRRPDRPGVYGDHATHVVHDNDGWLVATSTWGDFEEPRNRAERRTHSSLRVTLAVTDADVLRGTHVLDTRELPLPVGGLDSLATWDPHLVRRDTTWWIGYVSAHRFFSFHPVLAAGPALDDLSLRGAAQDRTATEGTTLLDLDGDLVVLASDGRQGRSGQRAQFPVFDTRLSQIGHLDAPYPTNLPWPSVVRVGDSWLLVAFNGRPYGGKLLGYGTHGDVVVMRTSGAASHRLV